MSHPPATIVEMNYRRDLMAPLRPGIAVVAEGGEEGELFGNRDALDAVTELFGEFRMVRKLDAIGTPAPEVTAFQPPDSQARDNLGFLPRNRWLKAGDHLWLCHDGSVLLLAHHFPQVSEKLGA